MTVLGARVLVGHFLALVIVLGAFVWLLPEPEIQDRQMMEYVGQGVINPGCHNLNCFRILVPAIVELFPGPTLPRWRWYAALCNAAGAIVTGQLALALGLAPRAALLAMWLSALGVGSFATLYHPYTADSMMFFLAPLLTLLIVRGRIGAAAGLASVGIFAKEFAAAPLFITAGAAGLRRDWTACARLLKAAIAVTVLWVCFQIGFMVVFDYGYDNNPSARLFEGGYFVFWLRHIGVRTAVVTLLTTYGALYVLAVFGVFRAPAQLRALTIAAVPPALAFMYVETPDRALFNFYFLLAPLAALVVAQLPVVLGWVFVVAYGLTNVRVGGQWELIPAARYPFVISLLVALAAIAVAWRSIDTQERACSS